MGTLDHITTEATADQTAEIDARLTHLHSSLSELRYGHVYGMVKTIRQHGPGADIVAITYLNLVAKNPTVADTTERADWAIYTCHGCMAGNGMIPVGKPSDNTFKPCDLCNSATYQTWIEGHTGCRHRDECNVCRRIAQTHNTAPTYTPATGRADSNVNDFLN